MGRSWLRMLCLAGGFSAAGCTDYGSYQVSWKFVGGVVETVSADCGLHGFDSIRVIGTSNEGDHDDVSALCAARGLEHSVPVGTWTFAIHQLDVRGRPIDLSVPMAAGVVSKDAAEPVKLDPDPVELTPRPVCADGIDNDGDGRVDLDDPTCLVDASAAAE